MGNNWTSEQLEAITQRGCNLLVAAAAGAGKTAVLVERIIREITDGEKPVDIDRLLVVTFTNAAATEMRERIGSALADALEANPGDANLQKQMVLLDRASIMTLHSFCLEVVRSHFHELELDPAFRIADDTECTLMKLDILEELFEAKYENEEADSTFFQLVESYGGRRDDDALRDILLALHRFTRSHPWPGQWLAAQAEAFRVDASACLSSTPWARVLLKGAAAELQGLLALLEKAAGLASRARGLEPYCGVLAGDRQALERLLELCQAASGLAPQPAAAATDNAALDASIPMDATAFAAANAASGLAPQPATAATAPVATDATSTGSTGATASGAAEAVPDWDSVHAAFASWEPARLPRCGKEVDTSAQDEVKAMRNLMKDKLKKLCESGLNVSSSELLEDYRRLYPLFRYLSAMVCEFDELYARKKKAKGLLDFNDLEHFCLKVLLEDGQPTEAAVELRKRYEEILVDEYQDSNLIQELILGTVSGNQDGRFNIFMVGDVKQSIYRFRQAKPELFLTKYSTYPRDCGHDSRVIQLYKNFRSRSGVICGVNYIFGQVMSSLVGELDYTEKEALNPGAVFAEAESGCNTGGPIELHVIDVTSKAVVPELDRDRTDSAVEEAFHPSSADLPGKSGADAGDIREGAGSGDDMAGNDGDMTGSEEEPPDHIQAEARITGKRIRELVSRSSGGFCVFDKKLGAYRRAQYRDIVILMRTTRNWADIFVDELAAMGIPAYADTGLGYFRTVEVETMLSLLRIIDNPLQDIPLLAVLRSPVFGFNADELADIRLADRSVSFYEAMRLFAGGADKTPDSELAEPGFRPQPDSELADPGSRPHNASDRELLGRDTEDYKISDYAPVNRTTPEKETDSLSATRRKAGRFLEKLQGWRDTALFTPTDELVWKLLTETGYYSYVGILPGGPERQANLRMLFERARQYEETSYKGLFNFINFINKLRSGGGDMGSARVLGENDNVVRIMSIHKSKGLEFPVVIVSGCGKKFNMQDLNASILLHQELGYGPDIVDLQKRTIVPSLPKHAIRQKLRLETLSEEMRILYVAFTRAREKLILTGCVRDISRTCSRWCSIADVKETCLPPYDMQQAATCLEWIGPALARHEDAEPIRMAAAPHRSPELLRDEKSSWDIRLWGMGAAAVEKEAAAAGGSIRQWLEAKEDSASAADYSSEELIRKLEWEYPFKTLSVMPAKLSVTELKKRFAAEEQPEAATPFIQPMAARPAFMEPAKGLDAARRGSVMHFVMQHLDLKRLASIKRALETGGGKEIDGGITGCDTIDGGEFFNCPAPGSSTGDRNTTNTTGASAAGIDGGTAIRSAYYEEIRSQIASMEAKEQLTTVEAKAVNAAAVGAFFETDLGKRMLDAESVERETAFTIEVKCTEIYRELPREPYGSETMLLQGVIDSWFETEEGIVLLDYKTDYVPAGGSDLIRERYKVQLDYYTRALERITGKKVSERYLYLFHSGELLKVG